jgi:putative oxidoreductase
MILSSLSKYRDSGLLLLRVGIGLMMVLHGFPKLAGGLPAWEKLGHAMTHLGIDFFPVFWGLSCALVETLGGAFLILGFCFRPVTILLVLNFLVATVLIYKTSGEFLQWSRPLEMLILFLGLTFIGAGKYSVDRN